MHHWHIYISSSLVTEEQIPNEGREFIPCIYHHPIPHTMKMHISKGCVSLLTMKRSQLKTQTNPDTLELSLSLTCDGHIQGSLSSIKDEGTEYCPAS